MSKSTIRHTPNCQLGDNRKECPACVALKRMDALILAARFPQMSKSTRAVNQLPETQHGIGVASPSVAAPVTTGGSGGRAKLSGVRQRKGPNKTEASFLAFLKETCPNARIEREAITLRWPDGMTYTPDFVLFYTSGQIGFYETKGPFIRRTGLEKFRAARAHWPMFEFELWQRDAAHNWKKLL